MRHRARRIIAYKPLLDRAIELASHKPERCVIYQRAVHPADLVPGRDLDWNDAVAGAAPHACVPVAATDPLYILYTSGTTGKPKGVVRDNGGHAVALNWTMQHVYGVAPGEVYWAASDIGWAVGHSYIVYAPLLHGNTTILFEGKPVGTPDAGAFWRVISRHKVAAFFTAPTAFRAIKREDPRGQLIAQFNRSSLRTLFLAGERLNPDTLRWAERMLNVPVVDHWWQTETGWPICANCVGLGMLPVKPGSPTKAVPGWDVGVLDDAGKPVKAGTIGSLVCKLPLPPGTLPTLWNADARYEESYLTDFPGYYKTGDAGFIDDDGYVYVMTRTDDVINVAGHRLSTGAIEEVLAAHPDVAECAVTGVADDLKGEVPLGFLVLKVDVQRPPAEVVHEAVQMVRDRIGAFACFKTATVVRRLPKTRSGKILRGVMQKIADSPRNTKCPPPSTTRQFSTRSKPPSNISATPQNWGRDKFHFLPRVRRVYDSGPQPILLQQRQVVRILGPLRSTKGQRGQDAPRLVTFRHQGIRRSRLRQTREPFAQMHQRLGAAIVVGAAAPRIPNDLPKHAGFGLVRIAIVLQRLRPHRIAGIHWSSLSRFCRHVEETGEVWRPAAVSP